MKKLLIVAQLPPPVHGASVVNQSVVQSRELRKRFSVTVVPIDATTELSEIRKFSLAKVARTLRTLARVAICLQRERPQLAYLTMAQKGFAFYRDAALVGLFRLAGVPHVLHFHGRGMRAAHRGKWSEALAIKILGKATVIHLSPRLKEDISPFVEDRQIRFVANGVADTQTGMGPPPRNGRTAVPVILFLGTMLESKGPLVLLEALGILSSRQIAFRALFAGPWRGSLTPDHFERHVRKAGIERHVRHLGPVYGDDKAALLNSADILAFPTHYENEAFPLVVLEGMSAGLVPVTTDIAALPDIVAGVGLCVPPHDALALADALQSLVTDRPSLAVLQAKARGKYLRQFTLQRFDEALAEVLVAAAGADRAPANDMTAEMQT